MQRTTWYFFIAAVVVLVLVVPGWAGRVSSSPSNSSVACAPIVSRAPSPTPTVTPPPTPVPTLTPAPDQPPPPEGANVVCEQYGAAQMCAWVSEAVVAPDAAVTGYGRLLVNSAPQVGHTMNSVWLSHTRGYLYCNGHLTGPDGVASCTRPAHGWPEPGVNMSIVVHIGQYRATTWFTTR
jgi:hypothetical protein